MESALRELTADEIIAGLAHHAMTHACDCEPCRQLRRIHWIGRPHISQDAPTDPTAPQGEGRRPR